MVRMRSESTMLEERRQSTQPHYTVPRGRLTSLLVSSIRCPRYGKNSSTRLSSITGWLLK